MPKAILYRRVPLVLTVVVSLFLGACGSDDSPGGDGQSDATTPAFGAVKVSGGALVEFAGGSADAAVGTAAPTVTLDRASGETGVIGGAGRPTLVVFLAHWCPHCQAEVPVIVKMERDGDLAAVRLVAVATGTNSQAPNYPPVEWLNHEKWPAEILLDDKDASAARAYGLSSYPYLVALDAAGKVTARASGELTTAQIAALVASAAGAPG